MSLFVRNKNKKFPKLLGRIKDVPDGLWWRGEWDESIFDRCVAIVGSRKITQYGRRVVEKIIPPLVEAGAVIVSGFMYGVDQEAHRVCLESGGKTIAVMGWGIDWQVNQEDRRFLEKIEKSGLVVSEYKGATRPQLWMFPRRNRIIVGLCRAVIVVEAGEKSGSLITAELAKRYKRKLFAVPGPITSRVSMGTNDLIKSGQAEMVVDGEGVVKVLGWGTFRKLKRASEQGGILGVIENEGLFVDEIAKTLGKSAEEVGVELSILQLKGRVEEVEGKFYKVI